VNPIVAVALGWLILGEGVTTQMVVAGGARLPNNVPSTRFGP
jgi:drug/metabolite transporter (DMT)-like permease